MNGHILINRKNIAHNFSEIKKYSSNSKIMSVIKSDAYGHGMIEVAKSLSDSDSFAVATIKEAMYLRSKNITKEIVCLQGFSNNEELIYCSENNIRPVKPYLMKLKVKGSILSITNLVKTNVDPPSVADKDAKKDPNSTFLITVLSLFIVNLL